MNFIINDSDTVIGIEAPENRVNNITGSIYNDLIIGGNEPEFTGNIYDGGNGNDTIYGGVREDLIYGGNGNDVLYGGDDRDTIMVEMAMIQFMAVTEVTCYMVKPAKIHSTLNL